MRLLRKGWRRLTSMRTALVLLFLLAVAAVPGSLLPQRPLGPDKVTTYIRAHGAWGRLLDSLGFFDVFGSAWFAAIYLLLFVSLIGCLIPRIRMHARAMARALPTASSTARCTASSFARPTAAASKTESMPPVGRPPAARAASTTRLTLSWLRMVTRRLPAAT